MDSTKCENVCNSRGILEDKIADLQRKLAQSSQNLKAKENLIKLQQQQIHKIEDMYKKCVEENASVKCEHKRTLHDLENMKIILRSYENKLEIKTQNVQTQFCFVEEKENFHQLEKIKDILDDQNVKTDKILEILHSNTDLDKNLGDYIEDLVQVSQTLKEVNIRKSDETSSLSKISSLHNDIQAISPTSNCRSGNLRDDSNHSMVIVEDKSIQTITFVSSSISQNIPEKRSDECSQTILKIHDSYTNTERKIMIEESTECNLALITSSIQNYIEKIEHLFEVKNAVKGLSERVSYNEVLLNQQNLMLQEKLEESIEILKEKDLEIDNYKDENVILSDVLKVLNVEKNDIPCKFGDEKSNSQGDIHTQHNLSLENEDLKKRIEDFEAKIEELKTKNANLLEEINELRKKVEAHEDSLQELDKIIKAESEGPCTSSSINFKSTMNKTKELLLHYKDRSENYERIINQQRKDLENIDHRNTIQLLKNENEQLLNEVAKLKQQLDCHHCKKSSIEELHKICTKLSHNLSQVSVLKEENATLKIKVSELLNIKNSEEEFASIFDSQGNYIEVLSKSVQQQIEEARNEIELLRIDNEYLVSGLEKLRSVLKSMEKGQANKDSMESCTSIGLDSNQGNQRSQKKINHKERQAYILEIDELKKDVSKMQKIVQEKRKQDVLIEDMRSLCQDISSKLIARNIEYDQLTNQKVPKLQNEKKELELNVMQLRQTVGELRNMVDYRPQTSAQCINTDEDPNVRVVNDVKNHLNNLLRNFEHFTMCTQVEHEELIKKNKELLKQTEVLCNHLDQYKLVNASLLISHYELEKLRETSNSDHQNALVEIEDLRNEVTNLKFKRKPKKRDVSVTVALLQVDDSKTHLQWADQVEKVKQEKLDITMQYNKLRQDNCNLRELVKEQEDLNQTFQRQIEDLLNGNDRYNEVSVVGSRSQTLLKKLESLSNDKKQLHDLKEETEAMRRRLESENQHLRAENVKLSQNICSAGSEQTNYSEILQEMRAELKVKTDLIAELKSSVKDYQEECAQLKEEMKVLQNFFNKFGNIKEKYNQVCEESEELKKQLNSNSKMYQYNETLIAECKRLESSLTETTAAKEKLEEDFKTYVKTNELVHQNMSSEIEFLKKDVISVQGLQMQREQMAMELAAVRELESNTRSELARVMNESAQYKSQLEDMSLRIDFHLQEHLEYKMQVEKVKLSLEEEIKSLKGVLEAQNMQLSGNEFSVYVNSEIPVDKQISNLEFFIKAKEIEIKSLMESRSKAIDILNHLMGLQKCPFQQENFFLPDLTTLASRKDASEKSFSVNSSDLANTSKKIKPRKESNLNRKPSVTHFKSSTGSAKSVPISRRQFPTRKSLATSNSKPKENYPPGKRLMNRSPQFPRQKSFFDTH